jgi:hypothetical protein
MARRIPPAASSVGAASKVNWGAQILSIYAAPTELARDFYGTAIKILLLWSTLPFETFALFCSELLTDLD